MSSAASRRSIVSDTAGMTAPAARFARGAQGDARVAPGQGRRWHPIQRAFGIRRWARPCSATPVDMAGRHRVEAEKLAISLGSITGLAQDEEPGVRSGEAGSGRGLGAVAVARLSQTGQQTELNRRRKGAFAVPRRGGMREVHTLTASTQFPITAFRGSPSHEKDCGKTDDSDYIVCNHNQITHGRTPLLRAIILPAR